MREMGVPARYVLGYLPGKFDNNLKVWTIDRSAAHAWAEVYFPKYGWVEFDPTPGNAENGQSPTVLPDGPRQAPQPSLRTDREFPGELECADPLDVECSESGLPLQPNPEDSAPPPPTGGGWGPVILVGAVLLGLIALAVWTTAKRIPSTPPEVAYRGIARLATRLGHGPRPAQTVYEFASGLGELVPVAQEDLRLIATAKVEATYGRREPGESLLRSLGVAYRRVRLGLLRLLMRRPRVSMRPRSRRR
jgi:hypothetical protein